MLEEERRYYDENLSSWLSLFANRFVLVKGRELIGTFDTVGDALAEGARRFGLEPYLVRRVEAAQAEARVPALTLGLLNANSQHPAFGPGTGS